MTGILNRKLKNTKFDSQISAQTVRIRRFYPSCWDEPDFHPQTVVKISLSWNDSADKAGHMKCAAVFVVVFLALAADSFGVLRPRFPVKPMPPFSGDTGVSEHDVVRNSPGR